jgi:hypothetical protein
MTESTGDTSMSGLVMTTVQRPIEPRVYHDADQLLGEKVAVYGDWMRYCEDNNVTPVTEPHIYVMDALFDMVGTHPHVIVAEGWVVTNNQHTSYVFQTPASA